MATNKIFNTEDLEPIVFFNINTFNTTENVLLSVQFCVCAHRHKHTHTCMYTI